MPWTKEQRRPYDRARNREKYRLAHGIPLDKVVGVRLPVDYVCLHCGASFARIRIGHEYRFCSNACGNEARRVRPGGSRVTRGARELAAPGLPKSARTRLLRRWKAQGRSCAYCDRPATTVDHVVPLILGGTNWEGNLVPACRPCNSGKSGYTVMAWRRRREA